MSFKVSYDKDTLNLQKLGENTGNNDIVYIKTDLADFRSNYTWQNASDNNSVLTFDFKGKNIELENLPYEGDITASPSMDKSFVETHNIIYGDINTAIENSSSSINNDNKYKITFNEKLVLPQYSAGLFAYDNPNPSQMPYCKEIDLTNVDMNNIVNASNMFNSCSGLTSLDLSNFTGVNLRNAHSMFSWCTNLTSLDLSKFTGENVDNASGMFFTCTNLTSLNLSKFTGENVTSAVSMFSDCEKLASLDLSSFTGESLETAQYMFSGCEKLASLIMKGSAINKIKGLLNSYLYLAYGVTVDNDKTYRCTCTYGDFSLGVKITAVQEYTA